MLKTTTTIIIASPPFSCIDGKEGVDLALVCAAFDHQVNLVFVDAGILHLLNNQDEDYFIDKMHDKQLKALEFYDVEAIYAEAESMHSYSVQNDNLLENCQVLTRLQVNQLVHSSQHVVKF